MHSLLPDVQPEALVSLMDTLQLSAPVDELEVEIAASLLVLPPADVWQPDPKLTCYGGMRVQPQLGMQVRIV